MILLLAPNQHWRYEVRTVIKIGRSIDCHLVKTGARTMDTAPIIARYIQYWMCLFLQLVFAPFEPRRICLNEMRDLELAANINDSPTSQTPVRSACRCPLNLYG